MPVAPPQLQKPRAIWRTGYPLGFPRKEFGPTFPVTPILDDFNRANENPIAGNWSGPVSSVNDPLKLASNQLLDAGVDPDGGCSYWSLQQFDADQEAYADFATRSGALGIWLGVQNPNSGTATGYLAFVQASGVQARVLKLTAGTTFTNITPGTNLTISPAAATGDGFGFRRVGDRLQIWYRVGPAGNGWKLLLSFSDTSVTGTGYIGAEIDAAAGVLDNFGGGNYVATVVSGDATVTQTAPGNLNLTSDASAFLESLAPSIGNLALAGNTQVVSESFAPTIGTLSLAGLTQAVKVDASVTGVAGSLSLVGNTNAVLESFAPTVGNLVLSGNTNAVLESVSASVGNLILGAGTQAFRIEVAEAVGTLVLGAATSSLVITGNITITSVIGNLALSSAASSVRVDSVIGETVGTLVLTGNTQAIAEAVAPTIGSLTLSGNANQPALALQEVAGNLSLTGNVQNISNRSINSTIGNLILSGGTNTVSGAVSAAADDRDPRLWFFFFSPH